MKNEQQFIFLYDRLMRKEVQEALKVDMKPICFAMTRGRLWKMNEGWRKSELICLDVTETKQKYIYGMLFLVDYWNFNEAKVHAYYGSLQHITKEVVDDSPFEFQEREIVPFSLDRLDDLRVCKFKKVGKPMKAIMPVYNKNQTQMKKWIKYRPIDYVSVQHAMKDLGYPDERTKVK